MSQIFPFIRVPSIPVTRVQTSPPGVAPRYYDLTYPSAQDLVDGGALLERAFSHHVSAHLLHVQHERVQRLLDVRPLGLLLFSLFMLRLPVKQTNKQTNKNKRMESNENVKVYLRTFVYSEHVSVAIIVYS